jgi:hypothetical protein
MAENVRQHIFDPFFTTKAEDKRMGLELSIVYGTVMSHHGFIDVDTQGGHGRMGPPGLEPEPEKSEDTKEARSSRSKFEAEMSIYPRSVLLVVFSLSLRFFSSVFAF